MLKNYLKIALRNLWKYKGFSAINISGLSIGIAFSILTMLFIQNELSHDSFYSHQKKMYTLNTEVKQSRGGSNDLAGQPAALVKFLKNEVPGIRKVGFAFWGNATVSYRDKTFNEHVLFASQDLVSMFDVGFKWGNPASSGLNENEIVLSEEMARKYFENENPVGQAIRFETRKGFKDLFIAGVARPMSENSSMRNFDCIVSYANHEDYNVNTDNWTTLEGDIILQLQERTTRLDVQRKLSSLTSSFQAGYDLFLERYNNSHEKNALDAKFSQFKLIPLSDIYFNSSIRTRFLDQGKPRDSYILAGITLLVLVIASINFMILSIARSANRAREVGMRKVFGARRIQLMKQFWGEAFILCLVAMIAGLCIAGFLLPQFNQLMMQNLSFQGLSNAWFIGCISALLFFLALVAGSYPAFFLSGFQPSEIFRKKMKIGGNNFLTRALIVFQFGLSILLIAVTIGIIKQMNFVHSADRGFNPAQVINVRTRTGYYPDSTTTLVERFRSRALSFPRVSSVAGIGQFGFKTFLYEGVEKRSIIIPADEQFLKTLEIKLIAGRNFFTSSLSDQRNAAIVNETFLRQLGMDNAAVGRQLRGISDSSLNNLEIVGVVKDFHLLSLKRSIEPIIIRPMKDHDGILVRVANDRSGAGLAVIQKVWQEVAPGNPFEYQVLYEALQNDYRADNRLKTIVTFSAALAILLACLGLVGIVSIAITNRTREIGIRKVLGASVQNIVVLLWENFIKLVLIANVIGLPLAYIFLNNWLQNYAYRTDITIGVFALAGGLAIVSALMMIGVQTVKAGLANPVKSLRTE